MNSYEVILKIDDFSVKVKIESNEEISLKHADLVKEIAFDSLWFKADVKEVVKCPV